MAKFFLFGFLGLGALTGMAWADTVHFTDGTSVDGEVVSEGETFVSVQVGKGRMTFPRDSVKEIEQNDKQGDDVALATMAGERHNQQQLELTGLTREQRDEVRVLLGSLWSEDEEERRVGREKLVEMSKGMAVYQFIESYIPYSKGLVVPELLTVLVEIDPERARTALSQQSENPDPRNRAKALELMASYKEDTNIEAISRGMVDLDPDVQKVAAGALAKTGNRAATPALIAGLDSANADVRTAALESLQAIWGSDARAAKLADAGAWTSYWESNGKTVENAVDVSSLTPLVSEEDLRRAAPGHDE